ncbi:MAG: hypothetical protein PQJ61_00425 [Spirochaetales bacterium]|uniref:Uncharacterized protein n=1 Tax=Candidatus Thalassospirochaeta sargassi TaxID=3119039 RepID=A0AAJ1I9K3_9SPIO|nr:hypothetical protein [Spirochaetales bacterium]
MKIKVVVKGREVIMSRKEFLKKYQNENRHYQNKLSRTGRKI